ncbi:MAG TPA: hypothetical protein VMT20_20695 [Terriglobia bacterium]|nr:hypothetical protein [Terriglobia bacterium]
MKLRNKSRSVSGNTKNAFITTVVITGSNGEVVTGQGEVFFDTTILPERIESIVYDTSIVPNAVLKITPTDRASFLLDFSRPPLLDFRTQPSAPTPNNSNWFVIGETESWSTSLSTRLREFFAERATGVSWLHAAATYDGLLLVLGFPLAFWGAFRLGNLLTTGKSFPSAVSTGL